MKKKNPIKGLVLYTFLSARSNIIILFPLVIIAYCFMLFIKDKSNFVIVASGGIFILSVIPLLNTYKDIASKWNRFQLSAPVKRKDVITSKYITHLCSIVIAVVITGIFAVIGILLHKNLLYAINKTGFVYTLLSVSSSLFSCGLFYPLLYTIGANREEVLTIICTAGGFGFLLFIRQIGVMAGLTLDTSTIFCLIISVILFAVSYIITVRVYQKKDLC